MTNGHGLWGLTVGEVGGGRRRAKGENWDNSDRITRKRKRKNTCRSGPVQFKLMLFRGQLYSYKPTKVLERVPEDVEQRYK